MLGGRIVWVQGEVCFDTILQDVFERFAKAGGERDRAEVVYGGGFSRLEMMVMLECFQVEGRVCLSPRWLKSCTRCSKASSFRCRKRVIVMLSCPGAVLGCRASIAACSSGKVVGVSSCGWCWQRIVGNQQGVIRVVGCEWSGGCRIGR